MVYGIGFTTLYFRNYYEAFPTELVRAAQIDGASFLQIFWRIMLPSSGPIIVVSVIWQFTNIWNDFLFGASFSGPFSTPMTVALNNLVSSSTGVKEYNVHFAGAILAAHVGRVVGHADVVAFDMGGTTAKACLVDDGRPLLARDFEAARADRFKKGSGLPIRVPVIELIEIGAGGGSIARVDRMGLLKVGPDSAGADPGPACYGLGGREPDRLHPGVVRGRLARPALVRAVPRACSWHRAAGAGS